MSVGRIIVAAVLMFVVGILFYLGWWQLFPLFLWQHPMLSWLPLVALIGVGLLAGSVATLTAAGRREPSTDLGSAGTAAGPAEAPAGNPGVTGPALELEGSHNPGPFAPPDRGPALRFAAGPGLLAGLVILVWGLWFTLISPPAVGLDDIDYEIVTELPERTQPRLLPRSGVRDDPSFSDAKEIHLVRDPSSGELLWTGEWQAATFGGASSGVAVKSLDDLVSPSEIVRAGFDHSVAGITPDTLKGKAKRSHPFSRIQYPVLIPTGEREAFAIAPYMGYKGFPFRTPYLKGVLVYHQDGTVEDLTPEEAAARPELVRTGRIFPEKVARAQADALARSDELEGKIVDGEGNKQPFLTAIDGERTVWVTIINEDQRDGGVKAVVLADSSTGETEVWVPSPDRRLISTKDVLDEARALPLRWSERRCCDSDGHSYTVTLREVVEPRLAFKDGKPYYLVTVIPTSELALPREVEYTLLIDAESGEKLDQFDHVAGGPTEDARLDRFFR